MCVALRDHGTLLEVPDEGKIKLSHTIECQCERTSWRAFVDSYAHTGNKTHKHKHEHKHEHKIYACTRRRADTTSTSRHAHFHEVGHVLGPCADIVAVLVFPRWFDWRTRDWAVPQASPSVCHELNRNEPSPPPKPRIEIQVMLIPPPPIRRMLRDVV